MIETMKMRKAAFLVFVLSMLSEAMAAAPTVGSNPEAVFKKLGCWMVNLLSSPILVGVAGGVLLLVFGWGKIFGEMNAFQAFKNGVIGVVIVLVSAGVSTTLFGAGCAA
jgi:type IV secretory pathway VirB2 component (pilin)